MTHKCIKEQAIKIAREATGYLPADNEQVKTIMRGAIKMAEWLLDHAWHNSNKEQPDGSSMVVAIHKDGSGSVHQFTNIFPNMKWAYLDDLRLEKQQTRR
jgi:hypothetical protein